MTEQECSTPSCSYPRPQGQWVCKICVQAVTRDLASVPALIDDLHTTLTRQDRIGAASSGRGAETALPWKERASEALWVLFQTVLAAARDVVPAGGTPMPDTPAAAARWLTTNLHALTVHPDAGRLVDEIAAATKQAYEVIDRPPDLLLAGQCGHEGCGEYLYATVSSRSTRCRECGAEHSVAERRAWMMQYAAELSLTPTMALGWVRLLMGKTIPRGTWDSWVARGRLSVCARDHVGNALYRFGDVRDLAADWVAKPRKDNVA